MANLEFPYIYHSHTERCGHSFGKDEEIVLSAIEHGVKVLCMTDHTPIPPFIQEGIRMLPEQLDDYIETWTKLKEKYKGQIEIHVCLEAEYSPEYHYFLKDFVLNKGIEYLILGEHCYIENNEIVWANNKKYGSHDVSNEVKLKKYVDYVCEAMNKGFFKYFAHPDFYIVGQGCFDEEQEKAARKIIETAIKNDVILEFNIHGAYNHHWKEFGYPNSYFWKMVANEYPEAKVTIGLDTHSMIEYEDNPNLREAIRFIESIGLKVIDRIDINFIIQEERKAFQKI